MLKLIHNGVHLGNNVKTMRLSIGMEQEQFALLTGIDLHRLRLLEEREYIDIVTLKQIAQATNIPVERINTQH